MGSSSPSVHGHSPMLGVSPGVLSTESDRHVSSSLTSPMFASVSSAPATPNIRPMQTRSKSGIVKPEHFISLPASLVEIEPINFKQASQHPKWQDTMSEEYNALLSNDTWEWAPS